MIPSAFRQGTKVCHIVPGRWVPFFSRAGSCPSLITVKVKTCCAHLTDEETEAQGRGK